MVWEELKVIGEKIDCIFGHRCKNGGFHEGLDVGARNLYLKKVSFVSGIGG